MSLGEKLFAPMTLKLLKLDLESVACGKDQRRHTYQNSDVICRDVEECLERRRGFD